MSQKLFKDSQCVNCCITKTEFPIYLRHGFFRRKFLVFAEKNFGPKTRREEKQLDTQCTPLCLVFPPGALSGGHTHRSSGIPRGA